jgi:hypothetical protein
MTSVLAMLYLVLFGTLAIGFYAATNTQTQIVNNDERAARAQLAAESGMDFMRYQLGRVYIPPEPLPPDQVIVELHGDLTELMGETTNLGGQDITLTGNTIHIPANGGSIALDSEGRSHFRATITDWAGEIVVKVEGLDGATSANRAITMDFTRVEHTTTTFDYAIASKGQIVIKKGEVTSVAGVDPAIATMMSAQPGPDAIVVQQNGTLGGDISILEGAGVQISNGASVGGSTSPAVILSDHVHEVDPPVWPEFDTSVYLPYATTTYTNGAPLVNIRIPANTNKKFTGNTTIQGIVYIESPNQIEFQGNVNLQGFIVFENEGDDSQNSLLFSGNVTQSPVPNSPQSDPLRATSGVAILAPTAAVKMTGSASSGDSYLRGSLITSTFNYAGAANFQVDRGTIMAMKEEPNAVYIESSKSLKFTATGKGNAPTIGVTYSTFFAPDPTSYQEVSP